MVGIEVDPGMAERAEQYCERVIVGDLDTIGLDEELGSDRFDVIVAADVLEHLKDPLAALRSSANSSRPGLLRDLAAQRRPRQRTAGAAGGAFPIPEAGAAGRDPSALLHPREPRGAQERSGAWRWPRSTISSWTSTPPKVPFDPGGVSPRSKGPLERDQEATDVPVRDQGDPVRTARNAGDAGPNTRPGDRERPAARSRGPAARVAGSACRDHQQRGSAAPVVGPYARAAAPTRPRRSTSSGGAGRRGRNPSPCATVSDPVSSRRLLPNAYGSAAITPG